MVIATLRESNSGPKRKYYRLTSNGIDSLKQFRINWNELNVAVNNLLVGDGDNE